jgi:hypothetical protein
LYERQNVETRQQPVSTSRSATKVNLEELKLINIFNNFLPLLIYGRTPTGAGQLFCLGYQQFSWWWQSVYYHAHG